MGELIEYGYWGLFAASFLAATILPFSSEAMVGLMIAGGFDWKLTFFAATVGNWLGGLTNYALGMLGRRDLIEKYLRMNPQKIDKMYQKVNRYGWTVGFVCWMPFVGDLLAVVLGFMRVNFILASLSMLIGKLLRYAVLIYFILQIKS